MDHFNYIRLNLIKIIFVKLVFLLDFLFFEYQKNLLIFKRFHFISLFLRFRN